MVSHCVIRINWNVVTSGFFFFFFFFFAFTLWMYNYQFPNKSRLRAQTEEKIPLFWRIYFNIWASVDTKQSSLAVRAVKLTYSAHIFQTWRYCTHQELHVTLVFNHFIIRVPRPLSARADWRAFSLVLTNILPFVCRILEKASVADTRPQCPTVRL